MPKISALPAATTLDGADPAPIVDDSAGSTKKFTLTKLKEWLQSLTTWISSAMIDHSTWSLNIKGNRNSSAITPVNGSNVNGSGQGLNVTFTVSATCKALVVLNMAAISTSDFEFRPLIYLDGVVQTTGVSEPAASVGNASGRAVQRSNTAVLTLTAGAHTISGGIFVSSATGPTVPINGASISAIVQGYVTA